VSLLLLVPFFGKAQESNAKVKAAFKPSELAKMSSVEIDYLNFLSENLVIISNASDKAKSVSEDQILVRKNGGVASLSEISIDNFNPLLFNLTVLPNNYNHYRIENSDYIVTVMSDSRLKVLYERYKANGGKEK
jgi:hypothetical protein